MIKSWRLARFKSVFDETKLEFAPLTIFAGANSSGKSTILQSILLTAQTLQSSVLGRPVILNGHIARLGAFPDIVSNADETSSISVGFELSTQSEAASENSARKFSRTFRSGISYLYSEFVGELRCDFKFGIAGARSEREIARLQPVLDETRVRVRGAASSEGDAEVLIRRSTQSPESRAEGYKLNLAEIGPQGVAAMTYEVVKLSGLARRRLGQDTEGTRAGATLTHFLPNRIALTYDAVAAEAARTVEYLAAPRFVAREELQRSVVFNKAVIDILREELHATFGDPANDKTPKPTSQLHYFDSKPSIEGYANLYRALPPSLLALLTQRLTARAGQLKEAVRDGRPSRYEMQFSPMSERLEFGIEAITHFFSNKLKYLGPLRDEPKPVYPLAGATDPADVGFRGEHTAAVLDVHRRTEVEYVPASSFSEGVATSTKVMVPLLDAVLDWLQYMGVGSGISTIDRGKLGHELKISTADDNRYQDLTQVGVGVSQVLPILVLSLLAEPGSTLIFEQPELHLHPRVQTRLADFFASMTRLDKQCIVETHSEYLINRLRYQAAIAQGRKMADSVIMYFVEKEHGKSRYRPVRINEFGVIQDWPRGFFDESEESAATILRAGLAKRKNRGRASDDTGST